MISILHRLSYDLVFSTILDRYYFPLLRSRELRREQTVCKHSAPTDLQPHKISRTPFCNNFCTHPPVPVLTTGSHLPRSDSPAPLSPKSHASYPRNQSHIPSMGQTTCCTPASILTQSTHPFFNPDPDSDFTRRQKPHSILPPHLYPLLFHYFSAYDSSLHTILPTQQSKDFMAETTELL